MDLDEAVRKLRLAQAALPRAQARADRIVADARQRIDEARADVAAAIVEASERGVRQRDIVAATGYTREWVRQIVREKDGLRAADGATQEGGRSVAHRRSGRNDGGDS